MAQAAEVHCPSKASGMARLPKTRGNGKGEEKTQQIKFPPTLEPGNSQNARIEQGIIGEEQDMTAAAG